MTSNWPPQWLTPVAKDKIERGSGRYLETFADNFGVITKDSVSGRAGTPLVLRDWQRELLAQVFARDADGGLTHRINLLGLPRKNGKSAVGSIIAAAALLDPTARGSEIYSCAADRQQARIVFEETKRVIESSELKEHCTIYRDSIFVPATNNVYRVLSADAPRHEGLSPTLVLFDELHAQPNRALFDVMSLAQGARGKAATMVCITTAGVKTDSTGNDSIAYSLYNYGKQVASGEVIDDTFFMAWWEAPIEADHRLPENWTVANPGIDDICAYSDFESAVKRTPEAEFRTKRLNQWVNTKTAWLPAGAWAELEETFEISGNDEYVLGFDGSWNNDSTSLVAVILPKSEDEPYRGLRVASWEKNFAIDDDSWVVDKGEVTQTIFNFFDTHPNCREMACDPSYWEDQMYLWQDYGLPVVEYRNSPQRTIPATSKLYEAIMNKKLKHNGDAALARHVDNCILKFDAGKGARITKDYRNPKLKIDNAIALMMAFDRAEVIASGRMETTAIPEFFA